MKILIAEDEAFSQQMLSGFLEKLGHEVVVASDGDEAWQILQHDDIRFVITDWNMPGLNGVELTRRIRSRADAPYVYVILLTVKSEKGDIIEGIMEGADDFLSKPYDRDELSVRIRAGERILQLEYDLMEANGRMKRDLEAAARIQESLLPQAHPRFEDVEIGWIFRPCDELAGDIFNAFQLDSDHIGFYLLDVVGHGVPAALLSVTLSRFLTPSADPSSDPFLSAANHLLLPSEVASELNRRFPMSDHSSSQFFTFLFGTLNIRSKELCYVSAGHHAPVYIPVGGEPRLLNATANGLPIGIQEDEVFRNERLQLSAGDCIVLYSDGLVEAQDPRGELFGESRLVQCLGASRQSVDSNMNALEQRILNWCDGKPPTDDISVLAVSLLNDVR